MSDNYIKEFVVKCGGGAFTKSYSGEFSFMLNDVNREKLIEELEKIGILVNCDSCAFKIDHEECQICGSEFVNGRCSNPARHF